MIARKDLLVLTLMMVGVLSATVAPPKFTVLNDTLSTTAIDP